MRASGKTKRKANDQTRGQKSENKRLRHIEELATKIAAGYAKIDGQASVPTPPTSNPSAQFGTQIAELTALLDKKNKKA